MRINPINTNNNQNFKAKIENSESLRDCFNTLEKYANSGRMKDMNSVKSFLDSIARINETDRIKSFKIDIDKRREGYTYTRINGRRISGGHNDDMQNLQDSYLVAQGIKNYASKLDDIQPSYLDTLKNSIEELQEKIDSLKDRYNMRLLAELEQVKKIIFQDVK